MESEQTPKVEADVAPALPAPAEPEVKPGMSDRLKAMHAANPRRTWLLVGAILLFILGFFLKPIPVPHVSLAPQLIYPGAPWFLTNSFLTLLVVDVIIIVIALATRGGMKLIPGHFQSVMESLLGYLDDMAQGIAGKDAHKYYPMAVTIFLLVIFSNWIGLIPGVGTIGYKIPAGEHTAPNQVLLAPDAQEGEEHVEGEATTEGGEEAAPAAEAEHAEVSEEVHLSVIPLFRAPSTDLNMTFALALIVMTMVQVWGVRSLGGKYFGMFFTFKGVGFMRFINAFVGILELIAQIARVIAFGFRLFGNIFAGEVVLATMTFLIPLWLPVPFYGLELFVGFVQALVFTMLTLVFFSIATVSHDHEHEEGH